MIKILLTMCGKIKANWHKLAILLFIIIIYAPAFSQQLSDTSGGIGQVQIVHTWKFTGLLKKISAIDYLSPDRMACLQDEIGSIYILNLQTSEIEREIPFGPAGDYEGLVIVGEDAYVACGDGRILEIANYSRDSITVKEYGTHLTVTEQMNGLCYDKRNKRLLVSVKGNEEANEHFKPVYAFNLIDKRMPVRPVIKIDLRNRVFGKAQFNRLQTVFQPSDLDINPVNNQLYIIDGTKCQLLTTRGENIRSLFALDRERFFQPEGVTITPSGEIFIASKGDRDEPGMLLQVRIKSKNRNH